jgi:hypothetical protein
MVDRLDINVSLDVVTRPLRYERREVSRFVDTRHIDR